MKSNRFSVLVISICLVLALSLLSFLGASAAPTSNEVTTTSGAPAKSPYGSGCTECFVLGLTSLTGNMNGQCVDSEPGMWPGFISLVIPAEGNRYLAGGEGDFFCFLNEKGVALSGGFRPAQMFPPYPGTPEYISGAELMIMSDSAAEYVELWSENVAEYGTPFGSECTLVIDPKEGYCLEAANICYGCDENHAIHGPMTDQVLVSANFFISERLKAQAEAGIGAGYTRAKRMWELLIDRQYDCSVMQPSPPAPGSGISLPYFMSCFRDHGNLSPEEGRMSCYVPEERGQGALCIHGIVEYTSNAYFSVARPDHTDLFSCLWMTPGQPCISPFLPVYIGINDVPEALGTTEGNVLFEKLKLAVEWHPEYRDDITQYWTVFEVQTIEESYGVEHEAAQAADAGHEEEARELLTEFVQTKCDEAMAAGQEMLDFLNGLPMFEGFAEAEAGPPYGVGPEESEKPEK
jgi:hypothetical protein